MKKLLFSIGLSICTLSAMAQPFQSFNILNVSALNTGTNTWGVTNLANLVTNIGMIYNPTNVTYTNNGGTFVGSSSSYLAGVGVTNTANVFPLFKDIPLWTDRNGQPIFTYIPTDQTTPPTTNSSKLYSGTTLFIEYVNPLGSNAPFGMTLRPVWDGVRASTSTADDWGFRIAGLTTAKGTLATNVPTWLWPGAKALRIVAVTNQYILAGPNAQTNSTFITKLSVNGYVP